MEVSGNGDEPFLEPEVEQDLESLSSWLNVSVSQRIQRSIFAHFLSNIVGSIRDLSS